MNGWVETVCVYGEWMDSWMGQLKDAGGGG